jgi:hypothetical protein
MCCLTPHLHETWDVEQSIYPVIVKYNKPRCCLEAHASKLTGSTDALCDLRWKEDEAK